MLFLFPPKINDDFVFQDNSNVVEVEAGAVTTYLTWEAIKAAAVAAGSALAPVAVGAVGAAAIGWVVDETIGWDVIADYGQGIIDSVLGNGGSVDDIYNDETETVSITPEFVSGAATTIDNVNTSHIAVSNGWQVLGALSYGESMPLPVIVPSGHSIHFRADVVASVGSAYSSDYVMKVNASYQVLRDTGHNGRTTEVLKQNIRANRPMNFVMDHTITNTYDVGYEFSHLNTHINNKTVDNDFTLYNLRYVVFPTSEVVPDDVVFSDLAIKDIPVTSVEERNTYVTNIIGGVDTISLDDKQAVTGVSFAEMALATQPEDIEEGTENDLGILGILGMIYNYIKTLPVRIVGAFTSLFNMIINAIKAISDAIATGIDNLLININAVGSNIRTGIDNLLINVSAIPDIITSGIDNLLINMGDWTDSLINTWVSGLGVIIGGINDIWSWLTGFGEWLINLVVPTSLDALQPSIAQLTGTFNDRFSFIITPIKSFGNAYSQSKSLYDVTFRIKYRDVAEDVHVLPIAYKPAVDVFRLVANGVVVVLTYISMYNRFRKEVLTG